MADHGYEQMFCKCGAPLRVRNVYPGGPVRSNGVLVELAPMVEAECGSASCDAGRYLMAESSVQKRKAGRRGEPEEI
jgi:hypothetical protein